VEKEIALVHHLPKGVVGNHLVEGGGEEKDNERLTAIRKREGNSTSFQRK